MAVEVEKSAWKRKKKRKSLHNEGKLLKDEEGGVMRGGIGSSTVVNVDEPDCRRKRTDKKTNLFVGEEVEVSKNNSALVFFFTFLHQGWLWGL